MQKFDYRIIEILTYFRHQVTSDQYKTNETVSYSRSRRLKHWNGRNIDFGQRLLNGNCPGLEIQPIQRLTENVQTTLWYVIDRRASGRKGHWKILGTINKFAV